MAPETGKFQLLQQKALDLGLQWVSVARAEALPASLEYLQEWLGEQRHGEMKWLARDPERRADPRLVLEGCRSVVVVGLNYLQEPLEEWNALRPGFGRISKYARTRDYHRVIEKILRKLARYIDTELDEGSTSRGYVDYGPVMERDWAVKAGLGFIGKNTLLINPEEGSFFFLAVILTTSDLAIDEVEPLAVMNGCGDCTKCLDACPTGALFAPGELDARRCLSYLTIEKKDFIDQEYWEQFEGYLFGCDICQDVCPYNKKRSKTIENSVLGDFLLPSQVDLCKILDSPVEYLEPFANVSSPLKRAGAEALARNALLAAFSTGNEQVLESAQKIREASSTPDHIRQIAKRLVEVLSQKESS
jgi:epoxyqueuosine reductase